jgi:hypothetical protein
MMEDKDREEEIHGTKEKVVACCHEVSWLLSRSVTQPSDIVPKIALKEKVLNTH